MATTSTWLTIAHTGFASDYNLLHTSGNGKIAYGPKDFDDILDWKEDVAALI